MKNEVLKKLTEAFAKAEDMNKETWEEEGKLLQQEESINASTSRVINVSYKKFLIAIHFDSVGRGMDDG